MLIAQQGKCSQNTGGNRSSAISDTDYGAFACENYKAQKLCMMIFKVLRGWISEPKSYNLLNYSVDSRNKKVFFRLGF